MSNESVVLFELIQQHKENLDWVLEKQAALRSELMTFYKKDLKEIQSALSSIGDANGNDGDFSKKALEDVQKYFINQWNRSYNLITPTDKEPGN